MKVIVLYDDTGYKSESIRDIIGSKGFADVVVRKRRLEEYYHNCIRALYPEARWIRVQSIFEYADMVDMDRTEAEEIRVLHCFSNYFIVDEAAAQLSFKKLLFVDEPFRAMAGDGIAAVFFPTKASYSAFCRTITAGQSPVEAAKNVKLGFDMEGLLDIGKIENFIQCITGNFDSRYFNSLHENEYTLVKSSTNKVKIKSEYMFYHLLPEDMKFWFVIPFNYQEDEETASYTMERLHMTDLAIKWVHGSMDQSEFEELMDKYFYFFKSRHSKPCSKTEYDAIAKELYIDKVKKRISVLKNLPDYGKIERFLAAAEDTDIDGLVSRYFRLKDIIEANADFPVQSVIGHGDPCFANALYSKSTKTLKFIDPKGALTESELWTNPYYDIAKLSHSICGRYDFFNTALFDIHVSENFTYDLKIPFDNAEHVRVFRQKAEENGFNYFAIRIYEASLFLSMLPLHIDNPHKVFGFILNARNILRELEQDV